MKSGFHLAIVQPRWRPDGGVERFVTRAIDAMRDRDMRISIICRRWQESRANDQRATVTVCNPLHLGRTWDEWSFGRAACRIIERIKPDCVHSHVRLDCCDVFRAGGGTHIEWMEQRGRSVDALRHLSFALSPYHRYVLHAERRLYTNPRIAAFICNSDMVREEIIHHYGTPPKKIHVIYNAVDRSIFKPDETGEARRRLRAELGLHDDAVVFLYAGSGFARKGVRTLLEALARVDGRAQLLVLGRDKRMSAYQSRAARLGISDRVHWAGVVKVPLPYFQGADAFALPTLYDPFSNAVLEAFAVGLPVLTSFKCGAVDFIHDGENGYICDSLDVNGIASRMTLLLDEEVRKRVGEAGRETTKQLTPESMAEQLVALYERVASNR